jgi:DNA-binding transcriptional LysR family regulator
VVWIDVTRGQSWLASQSVIEHAGRILHHPHSANPSMHSAHGYRDQKSSRDVVHAGVPARVAHCMRYLHACGKIRPMSLDIRQMRHVTAVADHGSFVRAATALGLSQSALSRSIQSVESMLGSSLFVRTASGVEPTDGGRVFIARIRQIIGLTEALDRDVAGQRSQLVGQVHVGGGVFPAASVLADALARFVVAFPGIVVRLMVRDWDELLRRLRAREIEYFVAETSTLATENDLEVEPLQPRQTFILARRGHPLARRSPVGLADCFAYPIASLSRIPPRALEPILAAHSRVRNSKRLPRAVPAIEFGSLDGVKRIVLASDALMVAPLSCVEDELEHGRLLALGSEPYLEVRYGFVQLKSQPLSEGATKFRDYVLEAEHALTEREQELNERWAVRLGSVAQPRKPTRKNRSADAD